LQDPKRWKVSWGGRGLTSSQSRLVSSEGFFVAKATFSPEAGTWGSARVKLVSDGRELSELSHLELDRELSIKARFPRITKVTLKNANGGRARSGDFWVGLNTDAASFSSRSGGSITVVPRFTDELGESYGLERQRKTPFGGASIYRCVRVRGDPNAFSSGYDFKQDIVTIKATKNEFTGVTRVWATTPGPNILLHGESIQAITRSGRGLESRHLLLTKYVAKIEAGKDHQLRKPSRILSIRGPNLPSGMMTEWPLRTGGTRRVPLETRGEGASSMMTVDLLKPGGSVRLLNAGGVEKLTFRLKEFPAKELRQEVLPPRLDLLRPARVIPGQAVKLPAIVLNSDFGSLSSLECRWKILKGKCQLKDGDRTPVASFLRGGANLNCSNYVVFPPDASPESKVTIRVELFQQGEKALATGILEDLSPTAPGATPLSPPVLPLGQVNSQFPGKPLEPENTFTGQGHTLQTGMRGKVRYEIVSIRTITGNNPLHTSEPYRNFNNKTAETDEEFQALVEEETNPTQPQSPSHSSSGYDACGYRGIGGSCNPASAPCVTGGRFPQAANTASSIFMDLAPADAACLASPIHNPVAGGISWSFRPANVVQLHTHNGWTLAGGATDSPRWAAGASRNRVHDLVSPTGTQVRIKSNVQITTVTTRDMNGNVLGQQDFPAVTVIAIRLP
jgi:hypothetical protein